MDLSDFGKIVQERSFLVEEDRQFGCSSLGPAFVFN
jgi:hypothetical protein